MRCFDIKLFSIITVLGLGMIVYSNSLFCSFHFDDFYFIANNPVIRDLHDLRGIWHYYHGRFLVFLSFALNCRLNGFHVLGYHLFNLAVHCGAALFVWWLTLLSLSTPVIKENKIAQHAGMIALFAGLIFVSHPLAIEAVTNIWQRTASMAAFFYLASLCFYARSRLRRGRFYYMLSLVTAVCAMFCKENTVTLPFMILFYEFTFFRMKQNFDWKYLFPFLFILFIIPVTFLFNQTQVFQDMHGDLRQSGGIITPVQYFLTELRVMVTYVRLVFVPLGQNFDYDYPVFKSFFEWPVLGGFLFLAVIFYWNTRRFSKHPLLSFFIFWFFLTLMIPESSFWVMSSVILEHRLYLPLAGFSIFLVCGVYDLIGKHSIKVMAAILSLVVLCNSFLTCQRNGVWKNELTLWDDAAHKSPHKARPYNNRGTFYADHGMLELAISDFKTAIALDPSYADAYYNLGNTYRDRGMFDQAVADYSKAIELRGFDPGAHDNRGFVYFHQGKLAAAMSDFSKAIEINPDYADAYNNRGLGYAFQGRFDLALRDFNKAVALNPADAKVYNNRGICFAQRNDLDQALSDFSTALKIDPRTADVYSNRASTYYYLRKYDQAWADVHEAEKLGAVVNRAILKALKEASGRDR